MLGMSFFFYEIQRAGRLPPDTRPPWRGDSLKKDGGGNLDSVYEGGYFDAGDHNKFMLPMAYSVARLCWATHRYSEGMKNTFFDVCYLALPLSVWAIMCPALPVANT